MKLAVISVSNSALSELIKGAEEIKKIDESMLELHLFYVGSSFPKEQYGVLENCLQNSDMAILDLMGATPEVQTVILKAGRTSKSNIIPIGGENPAIRGLLKLGMLTAKDVGGDGMKQDGMKQQSKGMNPEAMQKMMNMAQTLGKVVPFGKPRDMGNYATISKYWRGAGPSDMKNLLHLLLRDYGGRKDLPAPSQPSIVEETSICRPLDMKYYDSFKKYKEENEFDNKKAVVVLLYYGHSYPNRTSDCVAQIADKIKGFANILPIAFASATARNLERLRKIILEVEGGKVDLVINFMSFRLGAGPMGGDAEAAVNLLKEFNVPVLHPFFMTKKEEEEWRNSPQGISPAEFLITVMLPELDGSIETYPIGALRKTQKHETYPVEISELVLIEDRAEKLVRRVENWLKLRAKPAKDKKVAILCYNYPPGEDNLFGGAFLDTFVSVENLQKSLIDGGYTLELQKAGDLMQRFTSGGIVNSGRWAAEESSESMILFDKAPYIEAFAEIAAAGELTEQWGEAPGEIMSKGNSFLIPGVINGNIFIGLQPTRGVHENPEKAYHDKTLLPHHQYLAFYHWLKEEFKADILVHVGTHGTLEFLSGKECGMSSDCFPDQLVSDIPHAYLYYTGNPSEAMIAKRRAHAVLVGYQPPVFTEGELYGELAQLESLVNEFHEAQRVDPARCRDVEEKIITLAQKVQLDGQDIQGLERELYRLKRSLMPRGLHVLGQSYSPSEAFDFMNFVLRYDRGGVKALRRIAAEMERLDYDQLLENNETPVLSKLDILAVHWTDNYLKTGKLPAVPGKNTDLEQQLKNTLEYGKKVYTTVQQCDELKGFMKVLAGEYLPARLAGDMIRNPEVLPAGYNLYQFDPRLVPGEAAAARGARIASNTLEQYKREQGGYPRSTAVIVWGLETSRTQGETVGQILHYLGVRTATRRNLFQPHYEIIPLEELGRPRIDVVINICGFFRDMFPNLLEDLNGVFQRIAALDEPEEMNYFKANTQKVYQKLLAEGYSEEEARELSAARLFGPAEAEYGTGISRLIETKNWTEESQIGEAYVRSLKHIYSKNHRGRPSEELLNTHLQAVEIVSQVRSSHEYEVTDLDHYYEFFGGLSKSVEMVRGTKAAVYITDTTGERVETETVDKSIARGVRTRLLNPKWVEGMLEHQYHGVQKISDRFENILGLAATTNRVEQWIFSGLHSTYVADEAMRERLKENNRWAYYSMVETLLETNQRGYWKANEEEIKELMQVYLSLEGDIEEKI